VIETADDYGSASGLLVSPELFRNLLKPWRTKLNQAIKTKAPHVKIFHHTCGNVMELIPDLIETGIDILNPTQPVPGMEPRELAKRFGNKICFHGGIDTIGVLRKGESDVKKEILRLREQFQGASWIAAPANHLQEDVPPENIHALCTCITLR
jgi:uroporphyrinogen decarboxylase